MPGIEPLPSDFVDPALQRTAQVERAMSHVVRVIELELADIDLAGGEIDEPTRQALSHIGGSLLRMSALGLQVAHGIADTLGEPRVEVEAQVQSRSNGHVPERSLPSGVVPARPQTQARTQPASAAPVPVPGSQNGSRLDRRQNDPSTSPQADGRSRKGGREKQTFEGKLYEGIVSPDDVPILELREGRTAKEVVIRDDHTIGIRDHEITLEGDELFIFNGLLLLRDKLIAAKDIRALGFRPGTSENSASQAFSKAIGELMPKINQAAGVEIIKKMGERTKTRYVVNPDLTLVDKREVVLSESEVSDGVKKD